MGVSKNQQPSYRRQIVGLILQRHSQKGPAINRNSHIVRDLVFKAPLVHGPSQVGIWSHGVLIVFLHGFGAFLAATS